MIIFWLLLLTGSCQPVSADWEWLGTYVLPEDDYCWDCGGCLTYLTFTPSPRGKLNVYSIYGEAFEVLSEDTKEIGPPLELITDGSEEDEDGIIWSYRVGIGWALHKEGEELQFMIFFNLWGVEGLCNTTLTRIDCTDASFCECVSDSCRDWGWISSDNECAFQAETTDAELADHSCISQGDAEAAVLPAETTAPKTPSPDDKPIAHPPTSPPGNNGNGGNGGNGGNNGNSGNSGNGGNNPIPSPTPPPSPKSGCDNDQYWESPYGRCDDYYVTHYTYCDEDEGFDGVIAQSACPKACDACPPEPDPSEQDPSEQDPPDDDPPDHNNLDHDPSDECANCVLQSASSPRRTGCENKTIQQCVCDKDNYCCETEYDDQCVDIAIRDCNCAKRNSQGGT